MLQFESFLSYCNIAHFITTRNRLSLSEDLPYDNFNLCDYTGDSHENISRCRNIISSVYDIPLENIIMPRQVHGDDIAVITETVMPGEYDAVITNRKNIFIGISTADCVPILLYDTQKNVIAAIHAGWKGTVQHIAKKCILKMTEIFGTDPKDIAAGIGPDIGPDSFEVGCEVEEIFREEGFTDVYGTSEIIGKAYIDLWEANRQNLISAGVNPENIEIAGMCTLKMSDTFFSARKLGIKSGRIATCIMLK